MGPVKKMDPVKGNWVQWKESGSSQKKKNGFSQKKMGRSKKKKNGSNQNNDSSQKKMGPDFWFFLNQSDPCKAIISLKHEGSLGVKYNLKTLTGTGNPVIKKKKG